MKSNKLIRRHPVIFFFVLVLLFPVLAFAEADKIFKENSKAVVVVVAYDEKGEPVSQGSGFIIRPDGAVVTNYHVISNAVSIKIKVGDKILDIEGIIHADKENDLVILKAKGNNLPIVRLGDIQKANVGEKVYVISSPKGLENTISDGLLSGVREITDKRIILQITAPISYGSSGSPVFNKKGEVIGISTFLLKESQNINFAMPVNLIKNKISIKRISKLSDSATEDYTKTAEYWSYLGFSYHELGKYQEAIDAYKQASRIKPDYLVVYLGLALSYHESGMYQEAIDSHKQAIRIKPDYAIVHLGLAISYHESGKYQEAIDSHKQAIRIKPDYAEAHNNLGITYGELSRHQEAIDAYKQAIRIKPDYAEALYNLGVTYGELSRHQEAIDAYKQAIRIKPDYAEALYNLGVTYGELSRHQEAIDAYKQAIRIKPDYAEALYNLGLVYDNSGMYQKSIDAYKQAIRINPDYAEAHNNLGIAYANSRAYQKSIDAFKQAIRIKPDDINVHYALGIVYTLKNDKDSALDEYKILKEHDKEKANKLFNMIYQ